MKTLRNYVGGEWVTPAATEYLDLTNPATGEQLGKVPLSGARDVDAAVANGGRCPRSSARGISSSSNT